eukprot:CFRG2786T1
MSNASDDAQSDGVSIPPDSGLPYIESLEDGNTFNNNVLQMRSRLRTEKQLFTEETKQVLAWHVERLIETKEWKIIGGLAQVWDLQKLPVRTEFMVMGLLSGTLDFADDVNTREILAQSLLPMEVLHSMLPDNVIAKNIYDRVIRDVQLQGIIHSRIEMASCRDDQKHSEMNDELEERIDCFFPQNTPNLKSFRKFSHKIIRDESFFENYMSNTAEMDLHIARARAEALVATAFQLIEPSYLLTLSREHAKKMAADSINVDFGKTDLNVNKSAVKMNKSIKRIRVRDQSTVSNNWQKRLRDEYCSRDAMS